MARKKEYWLLALVLSAWLGMSWWIDTAKASNIAQVVQPTKATRTATPTTTASSPRPVKTAAPPAGVTTSLDAPAVRLNLLNNGQRHTGSYQLSVDKLPATEDGTHFELWLQADTGEYLSLGSVDAKAEGSVYSGATDQELLATYESALLSLEEDGRAVDVPSQVIYSGTFPSELLTPLRMLYYGQIFAPTGAMVGALEQTEVALDQSLMLADTLKNGESSDSRRYAEHLLNVLQGASGELYGDLDRDGLIQNPGDGYGLAVYLTDLENQIVELDKIVDDLPNSVQLTSIARQVLSDSIEAQGLAEEAAQQAFGIFIADDDALPMAEEVVAIVSQLEELAQAMYTTGLQMASFELEPIAPLPTPSVEAAPLLTDTETLTSPTGIDENAEITPSVAEDSRLPDASLPDAGVPDANGVKDSWQNPMDGAEYVYIPAGEFEMGANEGPNVPAIEGPRHVLTTTAFWIQRTEVSNEQYGLCVEAGACTPPADAGWDEPEQAQRPVTHVDWTQARSYAAWAGGELPSEAQWEKACRGNDGRIYPWGDAEATADVANFNSQIGAPTVVGSYPAGASPYGALDMSGNVWEWTTSLEQPYPYVADDGREDAEEEGKRVARGGSFYYTQYQLHCTSRFGLPPTTANNQLGFRVAVPVTATVWQNPMDGAEYVYIPAGEFEMGANEGPNVPAIEGPRHVLTTTAFWIQRTEVSNEQYGLCVEAGACTPPADAGWDEPEQAQRPVTHVDWTQARSYAAWAGGELPSEAQWEKACRGNDGRIYPWGDAEATADVANFNSQIGAPTVVGSYPAGASPYGALDMSGNVWEWTTSLEQPYPYVADDGREDAEEEGKRVARGGSFYYTQYQLHCTSRFGLPPTTANNQLGFRVVYLP